MFVKAEKRVFLALPLSPGFKNELEQTVKDFKQEVWRAGLEPRWLAPEGWHLTLLPPQNWQDSQIQKAQQILGQELLTLPFELSCRRITSAPPGQNKHMFWLEFSPLPDFFNLREEALRLLTGQQLTIEKSQFSIIHLTLAKFPEQVLENLPEQKFVSSFVADRIELWQSALTPHGAEYSTLASIPLRRQR